MEEAFGCFGTEMIGQDTGSHDPYRIAYDGDRDHQDRQGVTYPAARLDQVTISNGEGNEGHERAYAAARLYDLQRVIREDQDVSLAKNRHLNQFQPESGKARGQQLQRKSDLVVNDYGNGDHQYKNATRN